MKDTGRGEGLEQAESVWVGRGGSLLSVAISFGEAFDANM